METVVGLFVPSVRVVVGAVFVVDVLVVVPSVRVVVGAVVVVDVLVVVPSVRVVASAVCVVDVIIVVAIGHGAQVPFRGINRYCTVPVPPQSVRLQ